MKLYYYAFTGHKYGLDRVKRASVILNKLREKGMDTMLLVNDFRAGLVARDFGVPESISIEGIQDIDAVAENGDIVIIDSPEDDHGRLVKYCADFKTVFRFAEHDDDKSIHGEKMLSITCKDENCISSIIVDDLYFETQKKEEKVLFFLGDSDSNKTILNNSDFFENNKMELLLGNYFYVKYETDLEKIFDKLHEAEEYVDLICSSTIIVTASFQTALEAVASQAKVIFIELKPLSLKEKEYLELLKIMIVIGFNKEKYCLYLEEIKLNDNYKECVNISKVDKIIDKIHNLC